MKLKTYSELLAMSKEKIAEVLAPLKALETRKQGELQAIQLEAKIAESESTITTLCAKYPLDYGALLDALDDHALMSRRHEQLNGLIEQLFPVVAETPTV